MTLSAELTLLVKLTWSAEWTSISKVGHQPMESTKPSVTTSRNSRGMLLRACVAKTMMWTLDSTKGVLASDASISKASSPQVTGGTQEDHQTSEDHKERLE